MDVRLVGASFDTVEDNRAFAENEHFDFPLVSDVVRTVGGAYGVVRPPDDPHPEYALRMTFVVDPSGVIRRIYRVADIAAHPGELVNDLMEMISGETTPKSRA